MYEAGCIYHIYNRANGGESLFREEKNYDYFLDRYYEYINPVVETYAYCLLGNHFHMMVRVRSEEEVAVFLRHSKNLQGFQNLEGLVANTVRQQFSNFFNAYAKAFNKIYGRNGSLFQSNLKKKKVESEAYFSQLIMYIHHNPVKHGFVKDPYDWPHSSIHQLSGDKLSKSSKLLESSKAAVLDWFGGVEGFEQSHRRVKEMRSVFD